MITPTDALQITLSALNELRDHIYGKAGHAFPIEVSSSAVQGSGWVATIRIRVLPDTPPITVQLRPGPSRRDVALTASFQYQAQTYCYREGCWYENDRPSAGAFPHSLPALSFLAEGPERLHPLACLAALTVDSAAVCLLSFGRLQQRLAEDGIELPAVICKPH